jgi:hypothetical protein
MLVRDCNGKIIIVSKEYCVTEKIFNEKLYNIRLGYIELFNYCFENNRQTITNNKIKNNINFDSDD